jgi:hypothetical protein
MSPFRTALLCTVALIAAGIGLARLQPTTAPVHELGILIVFFAGTTLAGMFLYRLMNTQIGTRVTLSLGVGVFGPGCGALLFGDVGFRKSVSIGTAAATSEFFAALAPITVALTLALVI